MAGEECILVWHAKVGGGGGECRPTLLTVHSIMSWLVLILSSCIIHLQGLPRNT